MEIATHLSGDHAMTEARDTWSKIEILSKIVAALFLPIMLLIIAQIYTTRQKLADEARIAAENNAHRLTEILTHLSSDNDKERKLTVIIATYFAEHNQLPGELLPALSNIAANDPNQEVANAAQQSLTAAAETNKALAPAAKQFLKQLPGRVYIHIPTEEQRGLAEHIISLLKDTGLNTPGIQRVSVRQIPNQTELRYFYDEDAQEAQTIHDLLDKNSITTTVKQIPGYEGKASPKQFELWLK
jgi:hypothetical protein